ncbi:MAG: hypothetical protein OZ921_18360 [Sorangiineae bacterium]|nr:hypothetical protein [Polyangiaceae bacterium]MEB2324484.1 hypothetical protein [Sorangiineae bacterium]
MSGLLAAAGLTVGVAVGVARGAGDPRAEAEAAVKRLETDAATAKLAAEPLGKARHALDRARSARAAGDRLHGGQLEALALEWAGTASDLARAAAAEKQADEVERRAAEAERRATRARTLLEEALARRGRAEVRLRALEADGGAPAATSSAAGTAGPKRPATSPPGGAGAGKAKP